MPEWTALTGVGLSPLAAIGCLVTIETATRRKPSNSPLNKSPLSLFPSSFIRLTRLGVTRVQEPSPHKCYFVHEPLNKRNIFVFQPIIRATFKEQDKKK